MKIKQGGGHAGHNGLRGIHAQLGSADYWRLRLGIGHPGVKAEVADYVLRKPPADQREAIERSIDESLKQLEPMLNGDMQQAVMKLHAKPERPKPPRPSGPAAPSTPPAPPAPSTPPGSAP
jgi:PTH1 family peptidyl-tRNA hydrolase